MLGYKVGFWGFSVQSGMTVVKLMVGNAFCLVEET